MELTRRSALKGGLGAAVLGSLAGCSAPPGDEAGADNDPSGYAAFFTLWDWAEQVAGDALTFENPVPVGRMGHGWEPEGDLTRDIAGTDVFVYLDTPEFRWAQDVAAQLERDYDDIAVIDGLTGFTRDQLLAFDSDSDVEPDHDHDWDPQTVEVGGFDIIDRNTGGVSAYWHVDHWHGGIPEIPIDGRVSLRAVFEDDQGRVLPLGDDEPFQFDARLTENAPEGIVEIESHGDHIHLIGQETGRTLVVFQLVHDGEVLWETDEASMDVEVVDEIEQAELDEFYDPHVWVDPILAQQVIDNVVDGLSAIDPDNADTFESNAESYKSRLDDVHAQFEDLAANAAHSTAVFAGHDSFRYLEHRYGFELHSPTGISPDQSPSQEDIATTIELVDEHGIDTILYDPFETPDPDTEIPPLAETIVENSSATDVAPLTPAEGTTQEWAENEWGWVEQMEEINIPSLTAALGAEE